MFFSLSLLPIFFAVSLFATEDIDSEPVEVFSSLSFRTSEIEKIHVAENVQQVADDTAVWRVYGFVENQSNPRQSIDTLVSTVAKLSREVEEMRTEVRNIRSTNRADNNSNDDTNTRPNSASSGNALSLDAPTLSSVSSKLTSPTSPHGKRGRNKKNVSLYKQLFIKKIKQLNKLK